MSADLFNGADAGALSEGASGVDAPAGFYPELRLVKCKFDSAKASGNRYFKAVLEVLTEANGLAVGQTVEFFAQLEGNKHVSYNADAKARVMTFVGSLFGLAVTADINKFVNGALLQVVTDRDLQPETGKVVSAIVTYKPGMTKFPKWDFKPVLENGQPKIVRGKDFSGAKPVADTPITNPVAPVSTTMPTPVAPVSAIPAGWLVHPNDARFIYEAANPTNMKQV